MLTCWVWHGSGRHGLLLNLFGNLSWTPKSRYLISYITISWINSKVPEGSMITNENNSVARASSRVIILKSRLNSTGHSACASEVRDIFDRQTHVPNDRWQLMCSRVLQPWERRNSMTAPVRDNERSFTCGPSHKIVGTLNTPLVCFRFSKPHLKKRFKKRSLRFFYN